MKLINSEQGNTLDDYKRAFIASFSVLTFITVFYWLMMPEIWSVDGGYFEANGIFLNIAINSMWAILFLSFGFSLLIAILPQWGRMSKVKILVVSSLFGFGYWLPLWGAGIPVWGVLVFVLGVIVIHIALRTILKVEMTTKQVLWLYLRYVLGSVCGHLFVFAIGSIVIFALVTLVSVIVTSMGFMGLGEWVILVVDVLINNFVEFFGESFLVWVALILFSTPIVVSWHLFMVPFLRKIIRDQKNQK